MFLQLVDFVNLVERRTRKIRPFRYVNVQSNNIFLEKVYTYAFHTNCESLFISRSAICGDQFKYIRFLIGLNKHTSNANKIYEVPLMSKLSSIEFKYNNIGQI